MGLASDSGASVNIAWHLPRMAARQPTKPAIICASRRAPAQGVDSAEARQRGGWPASHYAAWTFHELNVQCDRLAYGLQRAGIARGMRTILMVRPSLDFFALVFALFKIGAVPVVIDPGLGRRQIVDCLAGVNAEAFIGVPLAHVLRLIHAKKFRTVRHVVTVGRRWLWRGPTLAQLRDGGDDRPYEMAPTRPDDVAAILFTSGSTGPPKGVVYQHGHFDAQVRLLARSYGFGADETDVATFPLFALFDPALGMTSVIPNMDFTRPARADPRRIIAAIRDHAATNMFASPALLNRLSRFGVEHSVRLPTLRRVISAGAPVPPAVLQRMQRMLVGDAEIHTPYGATEALPVATIGSREVLSETAARTAAGAGVCVGRPVEGVTVRIVPITDEPIERWSAALDVPCGRIGEIAVAGAAVTLEYWGLPEATRRAKIAADAATAGESERDALAIALPGGRPPAPAPASASRSDGRAAPESQQAAADRSMPALFHRMGDVGYFDDAGRLWMCGRKSHRVESSQGTLFTVSCEAIFNQHPAVARTALVGVDGNRTAADLSQGPCMEETGQRPVPRCNPTRHAVLCVELDPRHRRTDRAKLVRELLEIGARHEHTRAIRTILFHRAFPVDIRHNAKIFREKLAAWAAKRVR